MRTPYVPGASSTPSSPTVPLASTVHYGAPIVLQPGEDKQQFLARARQAMLDLRPEHDRLEQQGGELEPSA